MRAIKVTVVEFGDRKCYQMQWRDPITNRKKTKSTGIERTGRKADRTKAEKVAGKFEAELREGRYHEPLRLSWADFRRRYEDEVLAGLSDSTFKKTCTVFDLLEKTVNPGRLADVTEERLSFFQSTLRDGTRSENTISSYLAHLQAALRWAAAMKMTPAAPKITRPKRAKGCEVMKGRPVTGEEFERMLAKVEAGLLSLTPGRKKTSKPGRLSAQAWETMQARRADKAAEIAPSWLHYLQGLWLSGLRLGESLALSWDDESTLHIVLTEAYPMMRIPADREKGHKDRLLPITPDFAEFLLETPEAERTGFVFKPESHTPDRSGRLGEQQVGKAVATIGRAAGVKVATDHKGKVKFASAHDLRRSFGERWAMRVMPQVLKELMRHESIETTQKYYVGRNAQQTAKVLWEGHKPSGNILGNNTPKTPKGCDPNGAATFDESTT